MPTSTTQKEDTKTKSSTRVTILNRAANALIAIADPNYRESEILGAKDSELQELINHHLDKAKGVATDGKIIDWVAYLTQQNQGPRMRNIAVDSNDVFTKNIGDIYGYFKDIYKNKFIELSDLKFVSKFIPSIGEAVNVTLEAIISSDNLASTVTRNIDIPVSVKKEDKELVMQMIEKMEEDEKLLTKLMNIVYKKTLVTGSSYIYAIPYKRLFAEFQQLKDAGRIDSSGAFIQQNRPSISTSPIHKQGRPQKVVNESATVLQSATESLITSLGSGLEKNEKKNLESSIKEAFESVSINCVPSGVLFPALEDVSLFSEYDKKLKVPSPDPDANFHPAVFGDAGTRSITEVEKDFEQIGGTYIKYIDAKNIIPIRTFGKVIGYYYIHTETKPKKNPDTSLTSVSSTIFSSVNMTEQKKDEAMQGIANAISDAIIAEFTPDFVNKHSEYKDLIADVIIANGIIDNDYNIQFVAAEDIIAFKINENEMGDGESMLANALFPAKLLLSLLICKILTYMNKGGNKTIAHVARSSLDNNASNQLQRVTRMLQESQITFNDLLSTNLVFSKFTRDSNIQLPTSRNGTKLVEFEVQEGQQIELNTMFEEWLEKQAIMGTGVPIPLLTAFDQIEFAKSIETANVKFASRIAKFQSDLEEPTTLLYQKMMCNLEQLSEDVRRRVVPLMKFKLPRPKVLMTVNNSEFLQNIYGLASSIADIRLGQQGTTTDPDGEAIRQKFIQKYVEQNASFIDWDEVESLVEEATMNAKEEKRLTNQEENAYDDEMGFNTSTPMDQGMGAGNLEDTGGIGQPPYPEEEEQYPPEDQQY